jgi:hypothetical protein
LIEGIWEVAAAMDLATLVGLVGAFAVVIDSKLKAYLPESQHPAPSKQYVRNSLCAST